jgi:hypothetical protein
MRQVAKFGPNKTGALSARDRGKEMLEGLEDFLPAKSGAPPSLITELVEQASEEMPIGHVPPPLVSLEGEEERIALFMDKLGERLAFERTGVRLYEGVLAKLQAYGSYEGGPEEEDLERIREDELLHFTTLESIVEQLGGDPTAITPSANVAAVISKGICASIADPRTTLVQSLEAILVAELTDNECWDTLIDLARSMGRDDVAEMLLPFVENEAGHLEQVRRWLAIAQDREIAAEH